VGVRDPKKRPEKFGATDPGDDFVNLLDTTKKKYRSLIYQSAISEFDFKHYLFVRQSKVRLYLTCITLLSFYYNYPKQHVL
jgi:hypothetical protein